MKTLNYALKRVAFFKEIQSFAKIAKKIWCLKRILKLNLIIILDNFFFLTLIISNG